MDGEYIIPEQARIGHVHLKVANLERSLGFYRDLLGFELTTMYGSQAAFISAGGYHHHIGLNTWHSKDAPLHQLMVWGCITLLFSIPTRKDLAVIYDRLRRSYYPLTGASDHGVSEALYFNDPDNNGVELYWDKPKELWTYKEDGSLEMFTKQLDLENLLEELIQE